MQQLKESLHDWDSYESVKFGTLDSTFTSEYDNQEYAAISTEFVDIMKKVESAQERWERYKEMGYLFNDERAAAFDEFKEKLNMANQYKSQMDSIKKGFVPEYKGWSLTHTFRANNLAGNKGIHHMRFYFDKDITEIIDKEDIGEKSED